MLLGVRVLLSQPRLLLCGQPLRLEERAAQVRGLRARGRARAAKTRASTRRGYGRSLGEQRVGLRCQEVVVVPLNLLPPS